MEKIKLLDKKLTKYDLFGASLTLKLKDGESKFKTFAGSIYTIVVGAFLAVFILA